MKSVKPDMQTSFMPLRGSELKKYDQVREQAREKRTSFYGGGIAKRRKARELSEPSFGDGEDSIIRKNLMQCPMGLSSAAISVEEDVIDDPYSKWVEE